jgi:hypothetical protein
MLRLKSRGFEREEVGWARDLERYLVETAREATTRKPWYYA